MLIGHAEIAALLPHAGAMCLLDSVVECDNDHIVCMTTSHRAASNPMRARDRLGIMAGIEYASQAIALHAALRSPGSGTTHRGYLASLRSVSFRLDRLDLLPGTLTITACRKHQEGTRAVYDLALMAGDSVLMDGRAVVAIMSS